MVYAPQGQSGNFFNHQERDVRSLQVVEALTSRRTGGSGQHVFKVGVDLQHSRFDGDDSSQDLECSTRRRLAGRTHHATRRD